MTQAERTAIENTAPTSVDLSWTPDADPRFVRLQAAPCPLLQDTACSVWASRPLVCRTFMCGRVEVEKEPFEPEPVNTLLGLTGCGNLTARLNESLRFREHYRTNAVQELRRWGKAMGW
jgi:Fe-S-cluster containining protein